MDPSMLLPFPVQPDVTNPLPSWRKLPANPLCVPKLIPPQNTISDSTKLVEANAPWPSHRRQPFSDKTEISQERIRKGESSMKVKRRLLEKEDYLHYCDACQKGFKQQDKYDLHMSNHIYCEVPGCGFTCRNDRGWKMEEHVNMLHNRPNAPDLVDVSRYLGQRRARYPTQDTVKQKVEELYYKASRGAVLPDERRRWMRQHGVHIDKRHRSGNTYIIHGKLPSGIEKERPQLDHVEGGNGNKHDSTAVATEGFSAGEKEPEPTPPTCRPASSARGSLPTQSTDASRSASPFSRSRASSFDKGSSSDRSKSSSRSSRRAGGIGPTEQQAPTVILDGNTSRVLGVDADKKAPCAVQGPLPERQPKLVRRVEQQRRNGQVPRYYVCNRCGVKGSHWLSECPTKGDPHYDRQMIWGEPKRARIEADTALTLDNSNTIGKGHGKEPRSMGGSRSEERPIGEKLEGEKAGAATADDECSVRSDTSISQNSVSHGDHLITSKEGYKSGLEYDALPPPEVTARVMPTSLGLCQPMESGEPGTHVDIEATKQVGRMLAPVAAKKFLQARIQEKQSRGRGGCTTSRPPVTSAEPTLYERLTEEDRLNEKGLLLQAIRFFVARNFFC
ncbi:unnamed protein product [Phytomonas sp. EM1]|nr:unnamed protein product [Phytomonas sp. EM1]|eukprot:CCW59581.1 unnamed protein product [Phytomonas sp. isolate EM1]